MEKQSLKRIQEERDDDNVLEIETNVDIFK